jgi:hypothetical protein
VKQAAKPKRNICTVLREHLGQRTVLGVAIPVLAAHIEAARNERPFEGLTQTEIRRAFEALTSQFIKSDFHSTYIDRSVRAFLDRSGSRYRIRERLLSGTTLIDLEQLHDEVLGSLRTAFEQRQAVIKKLQDTCSLPKERVEERHALVGAYLSQLSGNRGEMFEVVSFAVLREYFRTFGFSLRRFSTTHANDGGMDFVGGDAIYQVTTDESTEKVRRDLAKASGTKRVLVRPSVTPATAALCNNEDVLETIAMADLLNHFISWLFERDVRSKQAQHLQEVLKIALEEFSRENRAETAELSGKRKAIVTRGNC